MSRLHWYRWIENAVQGPQNRRARSKNRDTLRGRRLLCEPLEDRRLLTVIAVTSTADTVDSFSLTETAAQVTADQAASLTLRDAINVANNTGGANTIALASAATYQFTTADNNWYGSDALPPITSQITIQGNGATLLRDSSLPQTAAGALRFFYVSGGLELPAGSLTLENLTLTGGLAEGGNSGLGGGGLGAGGAIFNQGTLLLDGVTLSANQAIGGSAGDISDVDGGGGMGQDSPGNAGGGFGGSFPALGCSAARAGQPAATPAGAGAAFSTPLRGPVGAARQAARGAASAG